jgi:hypothetical protein
MNNVSKFERFCIKKPGTADHHIAGLGPREISCSTCFRPAAPALGIALACRQSLLATCVEMLSLRNSARTYENVCIQ